MFKVFIGCSKGVCEGFLFIRVSISIGFWSGVRVRGRALMHKALVGLNRNSGMIILFWGERRVFLTRGLKP